jgi:hypothetical protein
VAANLLTDDVLMRSYQLTPEYRPLVDLHADLAPVQGNKGWMFGYSDALVGSTAGFLPFEYQAPASSLLQDGRWRVNEVCSHATFFSLCILIHLHALPDSYRRRMRQHVAPGCVHALMLRALRARCMPREHALWARRRRTCIA